MTTTDRERYLAMLYTAPLRKADAVVVLTGDGMARLAVGAELLKTGAAPTIVVSGGKDNPPHSLKASHLAARLVEAGVAPPRIRIDDDSQHTHEQAVNVLALAAKEGWRTLLLVASSYHLPRAFLTFLAEERRTECGVALVPVAASHLPWTQEPDGLTKTRMELLDDDLAKCAAYGDHVASFADGIAYLTALEQRRAA